jgi:hypothetical protein
LTLTACKDDSKPKFQGVDVTGADYAKDIPLTDVHGKKRSLKDFSGKVVAVFFGYTQCPDVCPTTLQELLEVKQALGADGDKLQAVFVSLDPERDTPEVLKAYLANFDESFVGLQRYGRRDCCRGQGLQDLLQEGARQGRRNLHTRSFGRHLSFRSPGPLARVRALWRGTAVADSGREGTAGLKRSRPAALVSGSEIYCYMLVFDIAQGERAMSRA